MAIQNDLKAIGALAADSIEQLAKLIQNEAELAKTEISVKVSGALRGVAFLAAATLFITPAMVLLLLALAQWLVTQGLSPAAGYALAAIVGLVAGLILALIGLQRLKPENLTPDITMKEIRRDIAAAEEITR
jgi:uncharacterized protein YacL